MNGSDGDGEPTVGRVQLISKITSGSGIPAVSNGAFRILREFGLPTLFALLCFSMVVWYARGTREDMREDRKEDRVERAAFIAALEKNTDALDKLADVTADNAAGINDLKVLLESHSGLKALGIHKVPAKRP